MPAAEVNRQIVIAELPRARLELSNFALRESQVPEPGAGEALCRTLVLSIDAGARAGLQGSASYAGAPRAGVVMNGTGLARVIASRDPSLAEGSLVTGPFGWQDYAALAARQLGRVEPGSHPSHELGVFGGSGLSAYFGLFEVGRPEPGETVLVSAAAGAVGHLVGQLARLHGCRAVGVAGTEEKCRVLTGRLGFDAAVSHRGEAFHKELKDACPAGVDVYFDNTGGDVLGAALFRMNPRGRIVCCGVVSQYDTSSPAPGPRGVPGLLVNKRLRMEGFLVFDHAARYPEARARLREWVDAGRLLPLEDVFDGLEQAPAAFVDLLAGGNLGKRVVKVAD